MYIIINLLQGNLGKGGINSMTSFELIWRLIVLLLLKDKDNESQDKNKE